MFSYRDLVLRLFSRNVFSFMKLGLENIKSLSVLLDNPYRKFKSIHIAGSNGKGSVANKIAKSLEFSGYRVGLFTSPHISCFRERICINGEMISEEDVEKILSEIFALCEEENIMATFFEMTTMLAFQYFAQEEVDFAVIETGLGGRMDATNIITPILSVVTSISLEHTDLLGKTKEEIAREKAGIIKPGIPVVVGPRACQRVMKEAALWNRSVYISVKKKNMDFEEENKNLAFFALSYLKKNHQIEDQAIQRGLCFRAPCRMQIFSGDKFSQDDEDVFPDKVILDAAHNTDAIERLFSCINRRFFQKRIRVVIGISKGRDVISCLTPILQHTRNLHLVESANGRGVSVEEMEKVLKEKGVQAASKDRNVVYAVKKALKLAKDREELLVICGSFFIMSAARKVFGVEEACDFVDMNERL